MKEYRVKSFTDLHKVLGCYRRDAGWLYRGQGDAGWKLVPRAGRPPFPEGQEETFFRHWKDEARHYIDASEMPDNEWEWLALAHNYGLATRFLSWTNKPLAAAFFAVAEPLEGDAVLYAYKNQGNTVADPGKSPFLLKGVVRYVPRCCPRWMTPSIGILVLHCPPGLALESRHDRTERLERIIIDKSYRNELRFELNQYGVNRQTLFPDLRGFSEHFNWIETSFGYWAEGLRTLQGDDS